VAGRPSRFDTYRGARPGGVTALTPAQRRHIERLTQRYNAKTAGSKRLAEAYRPVLADPRAVAGGRICVELLLDFIRLRRVDTILNI